MKTLMRSYEVGTREEEAKVIRENTTFDGYAYRWKTNNRCVPANLVYNWVDMCLISEFDGKVHAAIEEGENARVIAEYKTMRHSISDEQRAEEALERRAAFGEGAEVVNVLTGERFRT